ncbi:hypothetical protein GCM10009795_043760 [Nocardioides hankookensis]|uniref:FxLYD domain-containing protein n=1 Tax=Nocardioides hankookensis TaxID=443157 RepID=A0ABW1LN45_9ACTN
MRTVTTFVVLIAVAIGGAGCTGVSSKVGGGPDEVTSSPEATARPILVTQTWGVVDGMLSVVVRNTTDRTLRSAAAVITARDDNDVLVASTLESPTGTCCAVTDLPPGEEFGFYVDIGDDADRIERVDVAYREVSWAAADEPTANTLTAHPLRLDGNGRGAVVVADVRNAGPMVEQASVQAFLYGADGDFLAVVAGRWYCFSRGDHQIAMQLLHPVPDGTTVKEVVIHPVSDDPDGTALNCAGPARVG